MSWLPAKRPFTVTLTMSGVFMLGVWNVGRVAALLRQYDLLTTLDVRPSPAFQLIMSVGWAALFLWMGLGLWRKRPLAVRVIPLLILLYMVYNTAILFFFAQPLAQKRWPLLLIGYGAAAALSWLALKRPSAQRYFEV